ncbi:formate dehydrogenase region TAT target [Noviherbaspirillum humi]|uniref:Formate dehydrogenase region TAT target n=1 Tax=Noviherbaspirillum humi TaxID=1688639 RepID=A0A239BTQ2_9BURK|nr:hypothetical protein [Noviherbaspirillum humi]SNS10434.1 formate dehydrogenase region TAT target [Noviherbaspirillum humi]
MTEAKKTTRRSFFAGLGLAAAGVAAVKFAPKAVVPEAAAAAPAEPEGDGYRLTEHIKKYYRTTTI